MNNFHFQSFPTSNTLFVPDTHPHQHHLSFHFVLKQNFLTQFPLILTRALPPVFEVVF